MNKKSWISVSNENVIIYKKFIITNLQYLLFLTLTKFIKKI